jgi:hypothetical protein
VMGAATKTTAEPPYTSRLRPTLRSKFRSIFRRRFKTLCGTGPSYARPPLIEGWAIREVFAAQCHVSVLQGHDIASVHQHDN